MERSRLDTYWVARVFASVRRLGSRPCPTCGHDSVDQTTQEFFANAIRTTSQSSLSRWERGEYDLTESEIMRLAALVALPVTDLKRLARRVEAGADEWSIARRWHERVLERHHGRAVAPIWDLGKDCYVRRELHRPEPGDPWYIVPEDD